VVQKVFTSVYMLDNSMEGEKKIEKFDFQKIFTFEKSVKKIIKDK
jgi:hypothetical protein